MSIQHEEKVSSLVQSGLSIHADGTTVTIEPGEYVIAGTLYTLDHPVSLTVEPSDEVEVINEPIKLSADKPESYMKGTRLQGPDARDVNARNALIEDTVTICQSIGGECLQLGKDYIVSAEHAMVGLGPDSCMTPDDIVYASYRYALMRIDAVEIWPNGNVVLHRGEPHVTIPLPPTPSGETLCLAHIFRPYRSTTVSPEDIYPCIQSSADAKTATTPGRIPKTLAKLRAGEEVTIVCWGDSVTAGGNASQPCYRYVDVFADGLHKRFPNSRINVINISVGGSSSVQWLDPANHPCQPNQTGIDFHRIEDAHPDLVTIEFVNDTWMKPEDIEQYYTEILQRFTAMGSEIILITPHFTHPAWMGFASMREKENRVYVHALKDFAQRHGLGLADASGRWEHLWQEGIPYLTMLHNSLNHPDDRGHRLFAEELWKCFE
ncbi:MAG TPA: GDSL-type esterase/lipase family protein [Armatimonadota bacterium]|nr:GDSL-type esterase/lipase family protein [Armatimonadota bacterium]